MNLPWSIRRLNHRAVITAVAATMILTLVYFCSRNYLQDAQQFATLTNTPYGGQESRDHAIRFVPEESPADDNSDMKFMRRYGRTHGLPAESEMANMTFKELLYIYHSYLDNTDYQCNRKLRMGSVGDGGWEVCDDYEFRPIKPCMVYSFGINYDFSFDDDVAMLYGCNVYSFDPSMKNESHKRSNKVTFFKIGLGWSGGELSANSIAFHPQWKIMTLTDIKAMLGHQNATIDIIKIDIEHSEWTALVHILGKGEFDKIRQLLIEFHTSQTDRRESYHERLSIFRKIEAIGFRRFHTHQNPWGYKLYGQFPDIRSSAYEVYFVNTKFVR